MRFRTKLALVSIAAGALVPAWGYWYSLKHASLNLRVDDYSLQSSTQSYGAPHNVTLTLRDQSNAQLAFARSVEPLGYILAMHPDSDIGNCEQPIGTASTLEYQRNYAACYAQYSAWSATWASRVHSADITVGLCEMHGVPVTVHQSNDEWLLWWVPLPHVGGLPRQHFDFSVAIDSRACAPITRLPHPSDANLGCIAAG